MKIYCKYDELVDPTTLKDHPKNRNKHGQDQIERLAKLYEFHGVRHPIIVSKESGYIVAGHGRKLAAQMAGINLFPVTFQSFASEEAEYAFIQSDNAIAAWAELDLAAINQDLSNLGPDFDIDMLGIKDFILEPAEMVGLIEEDEVPQPIDTRCKLGDIWQLGSHRLMCGDSTSIDAIEKLMNGEKVDMVFTSPPYNCDINYNSYDDKKPINEYLQFISAVASNCFMVMRDGRSIFWNCGSSPKSHAHAHAHALEQVGFTLCRQIIWRKTGAQIPLWQNTKKKPLARNYMPNYTHENIFFASKGKIELGEPTSHSDELSNDVWDISQFSAGGKGHPAAFPVKLIELPIMSMTNESEILFEPFGGSGTTMIASEKTNRKCFMMELDPYYCDVILARWEKYTGKAAERLNANL